MREKEKNQVFIRNVIEQDDQWQRRQLEVVEERKKKDLQVAAFLKEQMDLKKRKEPKAMSQAEYQFNKRLLHEIAEKKRALKGTSRTLMQSPATENGASVASVTNLHTEGAV